MSDTDDLIQLWLKHGDITGAVIIEKLTAELDQARSDRDVLARALDDWYATDRNAASYRARKATETDAKIHCSAEFLDCPNHEEIGAAWGRFLEAPERRRRQQETAG